MTKISNTIKLYLINVNFTLFYLFAMNIFSVNLFLRSIWYRTIWSKFKCRSFPNVYKSDEILRLFPVTLKCKFRVYSIESITYVIIITSYILCQAFDVAEKEPAVWIILSARTVIKYYTRSIFSHVRRQYGH